MFDLENYYNNFEAEDGRISREKSKTRAKRRKTDFQKALRKRRITEDVYGLPRETKTTGPAGSFGLAERPWYRSLHQFSKNKIHCSCPMCAEKTTDRRRYGKKVVHDPACQKRLDQMAFEEKDFFLVSE